MFLILSVQYNNELKITVSCLMSFSNKFFVILLCLLYRNLIYYYQNQLYIHWCNMFTSIFTLNIIVIYYIYNENHN